MKRRAVIAGIVLIFAGTGVLAPAVAAEKTEGEDRPVGADRDKGIRQEGDERFMTLEPVLVSVIRHDDVRKLVTFMITLELADISKRQDVERQIPRLRDAYLSDLTRLFGLGFYDDRVVDLPLVKRRLLSVSQRVLGKQTIQDVLILNVFERSA